MLVLLIDGEVNRAAELRRSGITVICAERHDPVLERALECHPIRQFSFVEYRATDPDTFLHDWADATSQLLVWERGRSVSRVESDSGPDVPKISLS